MPLHLNLLHEVERARSASRRDPLKISLYILGCIVAAFAAVYFWQLGVLAGLSHKLAEKKKEFDAIEPLAKSAKKRQESLEQTIQTSKLLTKKLEGRFYWAPLLEQIATLVPREVQITKLVGGIEPNSVLKKTNITLDGLSAGPVPRTIADDFLQSIKENLGKKYKNVNAKFRSLDDGPATAPLDGKIYPTALFIINIEFQGVEEEATPPPRTERKKR